jgi:hypothetical protein
MITVNCSCGKTYQVKDIYANKKAKCSCGKVLSVPDISAEELEKTFEKIIFSCCNCGKSFNVSSKFQGKKVRCKSCKTVQAIPFISDQNEKNEINDQTSKVDISQEAEDEIQKDDYDENVDDNVAHKEDVFSENKEAEDTESSEKPKRVLIICLVMIFLGAIAYGLYSFYSEKKGETLPELQTTSGETVSEKKPEASTELKEQEKVESEVEYDEIIEEKISEEKKPEKEEVQPPIETLTSEPEKDESQSKTFKKKDIIETLPEPTEKHEEEHISHDKIEPESTEIKTQMDKDDKKRIASIDPKTLKKDTKKYLRTTPMAYTKKQVIDMIQKYNFYEAQFNPNGGFPSRFVDNRNGTITDNETLLMWQKSGTREMVSWKKAPEYIDRLNNRKFAGYSDWRLPTLEELLTLTEPRHSRQGLYISSFFSQKQGIVASADSCTYDGKNLPWYISFLRGISNCISYNLIDEFHVRAVRSMDRPDNQVHN